MQFVKYLFINFNKQPNILLLLLSDDFAFKSNFRANLKLLILIMIINLLFNEHDKTTKLLKAMISNDYRLILIFIKIDLTN